MTVKQQKIGLLSSSREQSALAASLPQIYQITSNAPLRLSAQRALDALSNKHYVLIGYTFKWIKVSFFPLSLRFSLQPVKHLKAGSAVLPVTLTPVQAYLQARIDA